MIDCPDLLELARGLSVGAGDELEAHLGTCATCRAAWDADRDAIALARETGAPLPAADHREGVRTALLARAERPARRRGVGRAPVAVAGVLAAAAAVLLIRPAASAEREAHGTITSQDGVFLVSAPPDELVRLVEGHVHITVSPLGPGERYRVVVGDAEVEVRGTDFEVAAHRDRLVAVSVHHGRVEVRPARSAPTVLETGQSWQPIVAALPPAAAPSPPPAHVEPAPVRHAPRVTPPVVPIRPSPARPSIEPPTRSHVETVYDEAWDALRRGDLSRAASGFAGVIALEPDGTLAEDAAFWRPVALARAGRSAEAIGGFRDFIDAHAHSPRAGEASTMLAWLLVDARELAEAERRFRAAADDPNPSVRKSARAGLDALHR